MEIANAFNNFFHSTFTAPNHHDQPAPNTAQLNPPCSQLSAIQITRSDIFDVMSKLDTTKATGCDNIHPSILKNCALPLLEPVFALFTLIMQNCTLPEE